MRTPRYTVGPLVLLFFWTLTLFTLPVGVSSSAANPGAPESRGAFILDLALLLGLPESFPTHPSFRDVPPNSPYYGYVEGAVAAGWVQGVAPGRFGVDDPIDRVAAAKILVTALGYGKAALALADKPPPFRDAAEIPVWAWGYVNEAESLGLMQGDPFGDFDPSAPLTIQQEGDLIARLKDFLSTRALGQQSAKNRTGVATTKPPPSGKARAVKAVTDGSASTHNPTSKPVAPAAVSHPVHTAAGLVSPPTPTTLAISAPATLIEDGVATAKVVVTVLDQDGNRLRGMPIRVGLESDNPSVAAVLNPRTGKPLLRNERAVVSTRTGVARFTILAGSAVGGQATLVASAGAGLSTAVPIEGSVPTPASIRLDPAFPCLTPGGSDIVTAAVYDANGQPLRHGTYPLSFRVRGGHFPDGTESDQGLYTASLPTEPPSVSVYLPPAAAGPVSVSVSFGSLSTSLDLPVSSDDTPARLVIRQSVQQLSVTQLEEHVGQPDLLSSLTVAAVNQEGCPVAWGEAAQPERALLSVVRDGQPVTGLILPNTLSFLGQSSITLPVLVGQPGTLPAGTYTFRVQDALSVLPGASDDLRLLPGAPAAIALLAPAHRLFVPRTHPDVTASAAVVDAEGNPTALAGVPIRFTLWRLLRNGGRVPLASVVRATDPQGLARATLALPPQVGERAEVEIASAGPLPVLPDHRLSGPLTLIARPPTHLSIQLEPNGTSVVAGSILGLAIHEDGAPAHDRLLLRTEGLDVTVRPDAAGRSAEVLAADTFRGTPAELEALLLQPRRVGQARVEVQDPSVLPNLTAETEITVLAGPARRFELQDGFGEDLANNTAFGGAAVAGVQPFPPDTPTPIWLTPVDAFGNTVRLESPLPTTVLLYTSGNGSFRLTPDGADIHAITVPPDSGPLELFYVNHGSTLSYDDLMATYLPSPARLTLLPDQATVLPGSLATLRVSVRDQFGLPAAGVEVSFSLRGLGTLSEAYAVTNADGVATVVYAAPSTGIGSASISATAGSAAASVTISVATP